MPRLANKTTQVLADIAVLSVAYWLAFLIRFDGAVPEQWIRKLFVLWPYVVGFEFALLSFAGVRRYSWRHVGLREAVRISAVLGACTAALLALRWTIVNGQVAGAAAQYAIMPGGVTIINFATSLLGFAGMRASRRLLAETLETRHRRRDSGTLVRTLLIGAGQAGAMVAREIAARPDLGIEAVAFLDDDRAKRNTVISGLRVVGTTQNIAAVAERFDAHEVLIAIASAPGGDIRRIAALCESANLHVKIIPGLYEIVGGTVNLSRIRDVAIEDLLGRDTVVLDSEGIGATLRDRVVVVTGAGGSIGSELCRQVCRFSPKALLLVEQAENALFNVHRELIALHPEVSIVPLVADVCDRPRMQRIFESYSPDAVFHAAAHKHVPMMEWNPGEAVKNNVLGTRTVADLSAAYGVSIFVQVSTDKAVNPTSVMGATKRLAEMYVQALSGRSKTRFVAVRFGNVLGSAGSVVPLFREQIAAGGPVTVTHPEMRRYFMVIPEACQLVLQAAALARGGEIFILDMGEPVKVLDLARDMIRLSGYVPDQDIEIRFTGIRPGEKLTEELLQDAESHDRTVHPKILVGKIPTVPLEQVERTFTRIQNVVDAEPAEVLRALGDAVTEATLGTSPRANEGFAGSPLARATGVVAS